MGKFLSIAGVAIVCATVVVFLPDNTFGKGVSWILGAAAQGMVTRLNKLEENS